MCRKRPYCLWVRSCRLFLLPLCFLSLSFFGQAKAIDSLQKALPMPPGTGRVNALNRLSEQCILAEQKDSAQYFAARAYQLAVQLSDPHGLAVYYCNQAQMAKHFDDDFRKAEALVKTSLQWYEQTNNKEGISQAYFYAYYATFAQGKFEESLWFANKWLAVCKQAGNETGMVDAIGAIYSIYRQNGNYEKSFLYAQRRYEKALRLNDRIRIATSLYSFAQLYELIENYTSALHYFRQVLAMDDDETRKERIATDNDIWFKMEFTEAFAHLQQFDSAWYYYNKFKPTQLVYLRVWWVSTGECYFLQKDYPHALQNLQAGLAEHRKLNDRNEMMRALLDIGNTYLALGDEGEALRFGREGLQIALDTKAKQFIRDGYHILCSVYEKQHRQDSANFYFRLYITLKDDVLSDQAKGHFAAYQYAQKIALANKEIELHQAQLKNSAFVKRVLITGIVLLVLFGVIIFRNIALKRRNEKQTLQHQLAVQHLESEQTQAKLQQKATELEMQALRAQMNPHFIFNSLNSINCFILQNEKRQASVYLTKFSRLIRLILQNSQCNNIPLERELEALTLYLEMESLRFEGHFAYSISIDKDIDLSLLHVPPLLIQPYVENAIWHGLMHKQEKGHLTINICQQEKYLVCKITDDGIGRKRAGELKSRSALPPSMGMRITAQRIAMLQQVEYPSGITITDLALPDGRAGGTEVVLKIPLYAAESHFD